MPLSDATKASVAGASPHPHATEHLRQRQVAACLGGQREAGPANGWPACHLHCESPSMSMKIHLIRHGQPDCPPKESLSRAEFGGWIDAYDAAGIVEDPPAVLRTWFQQTGVRSVFASTLPRAIQSARALVERDNVQSLALFDEAAIAIAPIPFRMSSASWTTLGRIIWLSGTPAAERIAQCRVRAASAADVLIASAAEVETVLVGHGWMNRMIGQHLRKKGFERQRVTGHGYWSRASFQKSSLGAGQPQAGALPNTSAALTPPKPKELDSA